METSFNTTKNYFIALLFSTLAIMAFNSFMLMMNVATMNTFGIIANSILFVWLGVTIGAGLVRFYDARQKEKEKKDE